MSIKVWRFKTLGKYRSRLGGGLARSPGPTPESDEGLGASRPLGSALPPLEPAFFPPSRTQITFAPFSPSHLESPLLLRPPSLLTAPPPLRLADYLALALPERTVCQSDSPIQLGSSGFGLAFPLCVRQSSADTGFLPNHLHTPSCTCPQSPSPSCPRCEKTPRTVVAFAAFLSSSLPSRVSLSLCFAVLQEILHVQVWTFHFPLYSV